MRWLSEYLHQIDWGLTLTRIGAILGAGVAMLRFWEWTMSKPKVRGEIQQANAVKQVRENDAEELVPFSLLLIQVYIVNTRPHPTTIKKWSLSVKHGGKTYTASPLPLPVKGSIFDGQVVFNELRSLAAYTYKNVLAYNAGVDGWLYFEIPHVELPVFTAQKDSARLVLTAIDSSGRKHNLAPYRYDKSPHLNLNAGLEF